ncbi:MAG: threonine--tRNA ligase [Candidatus Blackburnbacteria bacterium]|nr:threonine--tRNA ligase [Candidatus Blackburnbacteria bacterium]
MSTKKKIILKDHRQIAQEQELFFVHEYAPGAIFWMPKGWVIYKELAKFIREKTEQDGYREISTPVMVKNALFKKSGHWEHFGEHNMFNLAIYDSGEIKPGQTPEVNYSLKPMNCPEAALVFAHRPRSYKELPLKLTEFGILHRRELSGVLGGLLRVRQFVIDDAHLFVRPDQIMREIQKLLALVLDFYKSLGFEPRFYLATKPDKAMGDPGKWEEAEKDLEEALRQAKVRYEIKEKDGAFYGPKIDTHIKDAQNRDWQLATIQLDFMIPERMELEYIDREGKRQRPVMIHRGIFGSFERFIGMLIEHYQGAFPAWLSPVQAVVIPITDRNKEYAQGITGQLKSGGFRVELDDRAETLQAKIRDAQLQKIPYMLVVGDKEEKQETVAVRLRTGKDLEEMKLDRIISRIKKTVEEKKDL